MDIFVKEYSWMWTRLGLSLAECRVYAYIFGLTNKKSETGGRGYFGSKRQLAQLLGLDAGATKRILDSLEEKHLIVCTGGLWTSVVSDNSSVATDNESVVSNNESVVSDNSPRTPLLNNINNMKRNENIARDTIATQNPKDQFSFDELIALYQKRAGIVKIDEQMRSECQSLWSSCPFWRRRILFEELQNPNGWIKPRLDWTISDFNPQPDFLSGHEQDDYWRSDDWIKAKTPLVKVRTPEGLYKICTQATYQRFLLMLEFKDHVFPPTD